MMSSYWCLACAEFPVSPDWLAGWFGSGLSPGVWLPAELFSSPTLSGPSEKKTITVRRRKAQGRRGEFTMSISGLIFHNSNANSITFLVRHCCYLWLWYQEDWSRKERVLLILTGGRGDGFIVEGQEDGTRYLSMREMSCRQALAVSSSDIRVPSRVSCSSTSLFSLSMSLFTVCRRFLNSGSSFSWTCTMVCLGGMKENRNIITKYCFKERIKGVCYNLSSLVSKKQGVTVLSEAFWGRIKECPHSHGIWFQHNQKMWELSMIWCPEGNS